MSLRKLSFLSILATAIAFLPSQKITRGLSSDAPKTNPVAQAPVPNFFLPAQFKNAKALGAGKLLVASRNLGDPSFAQTVILLVRYDDKGVLGLIVNRRTDVPLSRVLDHFKAAKELSDPVYVGGPVELPAVFALFRSPAKVEGAEHVFGNVYLISEKTVFENTLASRPDSAVFHVYLGYAGWTVEQLQMEVQLGSWFIFPGDAGAVFNAAPASLWKEMIHKTELEMANSGGEVTPVPASLHFPPNFSKNRQIVSIP